MAVERFVLGLDVGTQSFRSAVFDLTGRCRGYSVAPLETRHPQPSWAEQDPQQWWQAAVQAIPQSLVEAQCSPEQIVGIGLDATACTVVVCDGDSQPLRPALLWMDQRSYRQAERISATNDPVLRYVSGVVSPEWMLPKALWVKENEPDVYHRADRIVECTNWFMYRLTGNWTLSLNHVTVKWNYARPDGGWSPSLLAQVGLEDLLGKWPAAVVPLGRGDGKLSATAASQLGLLPGTPVAQGGIDAYLGMLGLGAVEAGDLAMIVGSSTCHLAQSQQGIFGSGLLGCFPDATVEGLFTLEGGQTATGSIVDWYRRHFAGNEAAQGMQEGRHIFEVLDEKAAATPAGAEGLVCLDYWQGNRCPRKDPLARGTIWGLTLSHGPGHLLRAIYEATALGTRHLLEDAAQYGLNIERIFAGGGGVRSRLWMQIHADVLQQPIRLPAESEACALGSALVAAVHSGCYATLEEAAQQMVQINDIIDPRPENRQVYDDLYGLYLQTYDALKPLMHQQAEH